MNILYAASEAVPFCKTGGLADVAGSLPKALASMGQDVRVILPLYGSIPEQWRSKMTFCLYTYIHLAWRKQYCGLFRLEEGGVTYYFIDNEYYFRRERLYGYYDDGERFAFFSRAIVGLLPLMDWKPDVISCNDWQTALVPIYLRQEQVGMYRDIRTVFTIHNMAYQGQFDAKTTWDVFGLPEEYYSGGILRYDDSVNLLKGALYTADYLTTVSPSYARELADPYFAFGLHKVVEGNAHKLRGIVNGIDTERYDPLTDPDLYENYSAEDLSGKAVCKRELQKALGLQENPETTVVACVSRLVELKGFDLVTKAIDWLMSKNLQLVILGTGEWGYEQCFLDAQRRYPGRISVSITYSDPLAMQIYSGSDVFLMPSRTEPCGISQMLAMRYGSVPLVREVGGLRDTVRPYPAPDSNGFTFYYYAADEMMGAVTRMLEVRQDREEWNKLMKRCMNTDFSWEKSAGEYMELYKKLLR